MNPKRTKGRSISILDEHSLSPNRSVVRPKVYRNLAPDVDGSSFKGSYPKHRGRLIEVATSAILAGVPISLALSSITIRPLTQQSREFKEIFLRLVDQWRKERPAASSSIAEIIACPSYLRIIGMGPKVMPLIIEQMEREGDDPDHWCAALEAVTGEDPVPEEAQGDNVGIAQAWIAWHKTRVHGISKPQQRQPSSHQ